MVSPYHIMTLVRHKKKIEVTAIKWQQYNCYCNEMQMQP